MPFLTYCLLAWFLVSLACGLQSVVNTTTVNKALEQWHDLPVNRIWRRRLDASENNPFVFFHQRKSGGSTLRFSMNKASHALNITRFIPMFNRVKSGVFKAPVVPRFSIYAGHFSWSANIDRIKVKENNNEGSKEFSCLTNFREPMARLESCIYERFEFQDNFRWNGTNCINDVPIKRFADELLTLRFRGLFSCMNEPFRIFGTDNETVLNSTGFDFNLTSLEVTPRVSSEDVKLMSLTVERMSACVPIVLEIPESMKLLSLTFPVLYDAQAFERVELLNTRVNGVKCSKPTGQHLELMKNVTRFESILYQAVQKKVQEAVNTLPMVK